jgi:hypothetical protein
VRHLFRAGLALLLACPLLAQAPKPSAAPKGPKIAVDPPSFDFGEALPARTVEKEFTVRNFGSEDLVIASVTASCGCTLVAWDNTKKTIKPGASLPLRVSLHTQTSPGHIVKSVLVKSNDPEKASLEIKLEATIVAGN